MKNGVVDFIRPEECTITKEVKSQSPKLFILHDSVRSVDEEEI